MERPSIQDIFVTPLVGGLIGEGFYKLKRKIVANGYTLGGHSFLGNFVVFLIDPVNEFMGLFTGNPCRKKKESGLDISSSMFVSKNGVKSLGMSVYCTF